jgi:hypothetical protein
MEATADKAMFGLTVGGRKEEKLMTRNPMMVITLKGGIELPEKFFLRMWREDCKGNVKSEIETSQVHDNKTNFGTGSQSVFKFWGNKIDIGDQFAFMLLKQKAMSGKEKGKKVSCSLLFCFFVCCFVCTSSVC